MCFKQCNEPPWSGKKSVFCTRRCLILGWNSNFAFTMQRPRIRYRCSGAVCDPFLIRPIGPALCALPQQLCVSRSKVRRSCVFSMFSLQFPSAAWRGVAVSDMSSKNCDCMRSVWDLCPTISKIMKRRRTCRRRSLRVLLKFAPSPCEQV